jgi:hypothetical protein
MKVFLLALILLIQSSAYASWKKTAKYGLVGLAGYGVAKLINYMTETESEHLYRSNYVLRNDQIKLLSNLKEVEQRLNEHDGRLNELDNYVEKLNQRVTALEDQVKKLEEDKIGKKIILSQHSSGVIIKRSLFDRNTMERMGAKQYKSDPNNEKKDPREVCSNTTREELKQVLKTDKIKQLIKDHNISTINIDIIDSTNAMEDSEPFISLVKKEESIKKVLLSSEKIFIGKREKYLIENIESTDEVNYMYVGKEIYQVPSRSNLGGGGYYDKHEYEYKKETFDVTTYPAHSILSVQIPLVKNAIGKIECQSPIDTDLILGAEKALENQVMTQVLNINEITTANNEKITNDELEISMVANQIEIQETNSAIAD